MGQPNIDTWLGQVERIVRAFASPDHNGLELLGRELAAAGSSIDRAGDLESFREQARHQYRRWHLVDVPGRSVVLIGWPPGHATPVHDHNGLWGLELVLSGALHVEEHSIDGSATRLHGARDLAELDAAVFDDPAYAHACSNPSSERPALSLHVYGGALDAYNSYHDDGTVQRHTTTTVRCPISLRA